MDHRVLATAVLAVLLVLAGCAGFASDGDATPEPTATPAPTDTPTPTLTPTDTPTSTATSGAGSYPVGWTETGPENASAALRAHYRAVLTGPTTTVAYRAVVAESGDSGVGNSSLDMQLDAGARRLYASLDGVAGNQEIFFADGTFSQWNTTDETLIDQSDARFLVVARSIDRGPLKSQLLLYRFEPNGTVRLGGTTATVYDVTGVYGNTISQSFGTPESGTGRIVVAENGRILQVETTVVYTEATVEYRYVHTAVGQTQVDTPDWLPET